MLDLFEYYIQCFTVNGNLNSLYLIFWKCQMKFWAFMVCDIAIPFLSVCLKIWTLLIFLALWQGTFLFILNKVAFRILNNQIATTLNEHILTRLIFIFGIKWKSVCYMGKPNNKVWFKEEQQTNKMRIKKNVKQNDNGLKRNTKHWQTIG